MPDTVQDLIRQAAAKHGVPPAFALAVAEQESGFNPTLTGPEITEGPAKGQRAIGTFQIIPSTGKMLDIDPNDPRQNIDGGVRYLRQLFDRHQGDMDSILKEYGGVVRNDTYVPGVLARVQKFQGATAAPKVATPPPAAATAGMRQPSTIAGDTDARIIPGRGQRGMTVLPTPTEIATDTGKGLRASAATLLYGGGDLIRRRLGMERVVERPAVKAEMTPPESVSGNAGAFVGEAAQFAVPLAKLAKGSILAERLVKAGISARKAAVAGVAADTVGQAAGAAGVAAVRGDENIGTTAAITGAFPAIGGALKIGATTIRERAIKQLSTTLSEGLAAGQGPKLTEAIKAGVAPDIATARNVRILRQAASDTLELPINITWGKWLTGIAKGRTQKAKTLSTALKGELGDVEIPVAPLVESLDELIDTSARHLAKVKGGYRYVPFDEPLLAEAVTLKEQLGTYAEKISTRNLVDIKRTWDSVVFTLGQAGKVGADPAALVATAKKEAAYRGANGIRSVLEKVNPEVSELDTAVHHAIQLENLVTKLWEKNPSMGTMAKTGTVATFGLAGTLAGRAVAPGLIGAVMGGHVGGAAGLMLVKALQSPLWATLNPQLKSRLATAIQRGDGPLVQRILAPVVAATVSSPQQNRPPVTAP
jgi:hypothetical protein